MSKKKPPHPRAPKTEDAPEAWSKDPWRKPKRPQWAEALWEEGGEQPRRSSLGSGQTLDLDADGLPRREHVTRDEAPPPKQAPDPVTPRTPSKGTASTLEMDSRALPTPDTMPRRRPLHDPDVPIQARRGPGSPHDASPMRSADTRPQAAVGAGIPPQHPRPLAPSGAETLQHIDVQDAVAGEATPFYTASEEAGSGESTQFYETLAVQDQVDTAPSIPPVQDPDGVVMLIFKPNGSTQVVALREHVPHLIGRKHGCDIEIIEQAVSREHATLTWHGDRFELRDLGGRNGTLVNGIRVQHVSIQPGDHIRIGEHTLRLIRGPYTNEDLQHLPPQPKRTPEAFKRDPERGFFKRLIGFVGKK